MKPLDNYQLLAVGQQLAVVLLEELQLLRFVEEPLEGLLQLLVVRQRRLVL
jgi:hypothetical protein